MMMMMLSSSSLPKGKILQLVRKSSRNSGMWYCGLGACSWSFSFSVWNETLNLCTAWSSSRRWRSSAAPNCIILKIGMMEMLKNRKKSVCWEPAMHPQKQKTFSKWKEAVITQKSNISSIGSSQPDCSHLVFVRQWTTAVNSTRAPPTGQERLRFKPWHWSQWGEGTVHH